MPARDEAWFEQLYRSHHGDILRFARRRAPSQEADDVVAEVFATAWRRRLEVAKLDKPWLLGVARNEVMHALRGRARHARLLEAVPMLGLAVPPHDQGIGSEVRSAWLELDPDDRELLIFVAWDGLTAPEIGSLLNCSALAVRARISRARRRLNTLMAGDFADLEAL